MYVHQTGTRLVRNGINKKYRRYCELFVRADKGPYRIFIEWLCKELVTKVGSERVGHVLHEVRVSSAVVLNGQDQWILASHKCKLSNCSDHFLHQRIHTR